MACRIDLGISRGRREWRSPRPRPRASGPAHAVDPLVRAADLVKRVAALVPAPTAGLCTDDHAWLAFNELLDEAAVLVAEALRHPDVLGDTAAPTLRVLLDSLVGTDAVAWLLMERALGVLSWDDLG
ncbi:hypothetical protein [Parafrankia sp. FMc2]|uniref:hypothetical protein n=1 Tax=Parafrankia sp. FMc2 TaxID=3233196 RepID=UPI0034D70EDA